MGLKTMLQKWLGITPDKPKQSAARVYQAPIQTMYEPTSQRLPYQKLPQHTQTIVGLTYGKHYAKSYTQMYAAHPFEAWDRIMQIRGAVAIHHNMRDKKYELRITDFEQSRYSLNKKCVSKTFKSLDKCIAFKRGLIGKHNNERADRMLAPLDQTLFKNKYD
jgi:hypothetical protein